MKLAIPFLSALLCISASLSVLGQKSPETTGNSADGSAILREYDQAIDEVAERAMHSVVQIEVTGFGKPESSDDDQDPAALQRQRVIGSGVIVDPDGYIVTNNHVVAGALRIRVIVAPTTVELVTWHTQLANPQRVYEAKLIGTNRYADLAVIKIEAHDLPAIALPEQFHVRLGQTVIAIGSPQGLDHTITKGIISAVGRQPELDRPMVYVQTDAPINPGNSGGPLIDRDGNLIGINTFIYSTGGGSEGLGFAVPEPVVRFVYNELKAHGFVPSVSIGAHAQAITPDLAGGLKLTQDHGVIFSDVDTTGPAAAAGLRPGDIVQTIDGVPIDSFPKYTAYLYVHKRGAPLHMEILRGGKPVKLSVNAVDSLPIVDSLSDLTNPKKDLIPALGVFVVDLNDFIAAALPGLRSKRGVVVAGVLTGEPSTLANLEVGDVVRAINGRPLNTSDELRQQLANFKPGDSVALEVERQSVLQYVAFEVE
ncbi:trypsin-like peptidase domain-containing protein [Tunturiibacter gelidoferens]|uniref:Trypsin-like peptidase domain-containing protein n=1 Tax=Tunturiibacter gelidiferens TaxID=3069689 RepID=A0AAU7Z1K8_9BACT